MFVHPRKQLLETNHLLIERTTHTNYHADTFQRLDLQELGTLKTIAKTGNAQFTHREGVPKDGQSRFKLSALFMAAQDILSGLQVVQKNGICHRDIKPGARMQWSHIRDKTCPEHGDDVDSDGVCFSSLHPKTKMQ